MFGNSVRPIRGNATLTVNLGLRPQRLDLTKVSAPAQIIKPLPNSERFIRAEDWQAVTLH